MRRIMVNESYSSIPNELEIISDLSLKKKLIIEKENVIVLYKTLIIIYDQVKLHIYWKLKMLKL